MTAALATDLRVRPAPRREPPFDDEAVTSHLRLVGPADQQLPFDKPRRPLPRPAGIRAQTPLPDPARWGQRLLTGLIESAAGRRPVQQLRSMLSPSVAFGLSTDFERAAAAATPHWTSGARVQRVHASQPSEGVAELNATLRVGKRVRAIALRVEERQGRWICTRLQLG